MDFHIKRNINKRRELWDELQKLRAEKEAALDSISNTDAGDILFDEKEKEYSERIEQVYNLLFYLEYPEPKNTWFRTFSESFKTGNAIRISQKQAEIFIRYSEQSHEHETGRGTSYYCKVGNRGFKCQVFTIREPAYLTITEL